MQIVPIQALPSQSFSFIDPENNQWDISIRYTSGLMSFSFTRNGTLLIQGVAASAGSRIIPYDYLENGNFVLITQSQQIPDYTQFGITQQLVFLEAADILTFRQSLSGLTQVVASDFDPNGAEPLRFSPAGYAMA